MFRNHIKGSVLLGAILFMACEKEAPQEEIIRPVRYMQVYATGGSRVRTFTGTAQAGTESNLSFRVPGTVRTVSVDVGDRVRRGTVIAELDETDYRLRVQQAEAGLTQANAMARNAQANYDRVRALYENSNASRSDLDGARAANESAEAGVQSAEKALELAQLQLSYTKLVAPAAGAIASVSTEVNENINPGETVVVLTSGSDIEVSLSVPEVLISKIRERQRVTVSFDALTGRTFSATIREVGVSATGIGTTYPVTVRLDRRDSAVRPGMAASVACRFESGDERERFIVPSNTVIEDRAGRFVFVVEPITNEAGFGNVLRKPVTIGELTADGIEIFDGLVDGDLVITAGMSRIADGQKVRI